jgi:two-component system OmpR family sensor kinase
MSVTASSRADRWLWWGWLIFAGVNTLAMFVFAGAETVPFHFVWISLSVVYGLQLWSSRRTYSVLAVVGVLTGSALMLHVHNEVIGWEETTEVPLMTLVFLAMVWHVRRRTKAEHRARQLAESEREMREAQRRFVRFASHELRTPMTVARGYAELIRDNATDDQTREDAIVVLEELETLNGIAGRLLTLARSEQSDLLRVQGVDVDSLLQRAVKRWRPAADRVWSIDTHTGVITADQERLEAALDCLLDNALRYTEDGGHIDLRSERRPAEAIIRVRDDGIGIPPEERQHVFESFRAGPVRPGTGMGLAIVRATMEAHGGSVAVQDARGGGCEFVLRVPTTRTTSTGPTGTAPATEPALAPAGDERLAEVRAFDAYQPATDGHSASHDVDMTLT